MKLRCALFFAFTLAAASLPAGAQPDPRRERLEAEYNRISQEQQAAYQQFQMLQDLRRNELQEGGPRYELAPGGMVDYDEVARQQQARAARLKRYERESNEAYARFQQLGERKKAVLDQLMAVPPPLPVGPSSPAARPR